MMAGESVPVDVTSFLNTLEDFNSKDDVFTYLIHLGYLAYDSGDRTCRIPNMEVRNSFDELMERMYCISIPSVIGLVDHIDG